MSWTSTYNIDYLIDKLIENSFCNGCKMGLSLTKSLFGICSFRRKLTFFCLNETSFEEYSRRLCERRGVSLKPNVQWTFDGENRLRIRKNDVCRPINNFQTSSKMLSHEDFSFTSNHN